MEQASTPWSRYGDPARKRKYAALARVRPDTDDGRFEAACLTFPDPEDDMLAHRAAREYRFDRTVIEEMAKLAGAEPEAGLPSRFEQARDIYNLASDSTRPVNERLAAHKLYAEIQGHIKKPSEGTGGNTYIDNRRVMVMPAAPANADVWEANAELHQAKLVEHASR